MSEHNNDYTRIFKSTSLFGAVQIINILISIVRSKAVALLIGPTGMGIIGLLTSTIKFVGELSRLGLDTTAVREIALSYSKNNENETGLILATIRKVVWFTGTLGAVLTIILSPFLSFLAFDSYEYTMAFIWISVSLLLNQLSAGQLAIIQGFRRLRLLAKANLYGNLIGLLISLPLYYYFRLDAIVPVIIISSLSALMMSWFYSKKVAFKRLKITNKEAFSKSKTMLNLGFMLSLRGSINLLVAYVFQLYLSQVGGLEQVGYYVAGFMIINSYVDMVFNAMRTDYFPRLSAVADDLKQINKIVSEQSIIGILIIGPLVVLFLAFLPLIVKLLFSEAFLVIVSFVAWAVLGILFKTLSWSMGYVILAKGDSKLFIKTGLFFNAIMLILNILGFHFMGLEGLGVSFLVYYMFHFICVKWITNKIYNLDLEPSTFTVFFILLSLVVATFCVVNVTSEGVKYGLCSVLILISFVYSYRQLNKRVNFLSLWHRFFKNNND